MSLVAGIVGTTWGLFEARAQSAQAILERDQKEAARAGEQTAKETAVEEKGKAEEAERKAKASLVAESQARKQTRTTLDALTDDVVKKLLARQSKLGPDEKAFLLKVLGFYEEFTKNTQQVVESLAIKAEGFRNVASIHLLLGQHAEAEGPLRQAESIMSKLVEETPSEEYQLRLITIWNRLADDSLQNQGKKEQAKEIRRKSLALYERLAAAYPDNFTHRFNLGVGLLNLCNSEHDGQGDEAIKLYRRALFHLEAVTSRPNAPANALLYLSSCYNNLGVIQTDMENYADAEANLKQALLARERLVKDFAGQPEHRVYLANTHGNIGRNQLFQNKVPQGKASHRKELAIREQLVAEFPGVPIYQQQLGRSVIHLGEIMLGQNQPELALKEFDRAIALLAIVPPHDRWPEFFAHFRAMATRGRARALVGMKRYSEAISEWDRAIDLQKPPLRPNMQLERAATLARNGEHVKAAEAAEKLAADSKATGPILYDSACVLAISAGVVKDNAKLSEQYTARAVVILRLTERKGFFKNPARVIHLKKDPDFDFLRGREDFKKLIAELEARIPLKPANKPMPQPEK